MADAVMAPPQNGFGQIDERAAAIELARRYRAEFADLKNFKIQHDLLRTVPVELMFRFNFVPLELRDDVLGRMLPDGRAR